MKLKWYGHAAFRLVPRDGPTVITDPYTPAEVGYPEITDVADVVIRSSHDDEAHCRSDLIPGDPVVLDALEIALNGGVRDASGLAVTAVEAAEWDHHPDHEVPGQNGMYRFELDGIRIAHMGDVGNALSDRQIAFFEDVDLLFALAGGYLTIELPDLMKMIHAVRPKLVVPMHFRTLTYRPRNTKWIESFLSNFKEEDVEFACAHEVELTAQDIPDATRVLVLDYAR